MIVIAQISDTHVLGPHEPLPCGVDHNRQLDLAIQSINAESARITAVLATGDMTNTGQPEQLSELTRRLDQLDAPVLPLPGNHDNQSLFRDAFDMDWADSGHLSWSHEVDELRILGLDVTVPGSNHALFDEPRLQWLRDQLAANPDQPTAIAMHQPPFLTGIEWMDDTAITNRVEFEAVIADYPCISRIFCGHLHRPVQSVVAQASATVGLSTIYHVELNLEPGSSVELIRDPAGYQLHCWIEGRWVSHTRFIGRTEAAFQPERR